MKDGKPVVMVVDDDQDVVEMISLVLTKENYEVSTFGRASEAEAAIEGVAPDLMIVDLMMESIDAGTELVTRLRGKGVTIPIYLLSTVGDQLSTSTDPAELGLSGIIQKPIAPENLLAIVKARVGTAGT